MKIFIGADLVPTKKKGDVGTGRSEELFINGDTGALFCDVLPLIKDADRAIVNLECALTDTDGAISKIGPNIKASPLCAKTIKSAGFSDCALANNHVFDYGKQGLDDTLQALDEAGLNYFGIGNNDTDSRKIYYICEQGIKIAIVNVCEHEYTYALPSRMGANPFDPFLTMADIREAKQNAQHVIVLYHGGKEYCPYPSPRLYNACHEMAHNGADVIIAQHSHCIGCYEKYNGAHILYGQGNFHFTLDKESQSWNEGLALVLEFDGEIKMNIHPFTVSGASISLAKGEDYERIMSALEARNNDLQTGAWRKKWSEFCGSVSDFYKGVVKRVGTAVGQDSIEADENLAHYLDCEAHLDVLKELYRTANDTNEM